MFLFFFLCSGFFVQKDWIFSLKKVSSESWKKLMVDQCAMVTSLFFCRVVRVLYGFVVTDPETAEPSLLFYGFIT